MKSINKVLIEDVPMLFSILTFGSQNISFHNIEARELASNCVALLNEIRPGSVDMFPATETVANEDSGGWDEIPIEDTYTLRLNERELKLPVLSPDDFTIEQHAKFVAEKGLTVDAVINPGLHKYAKKTAFKYGVKFQVFADRQVFDGRKKKISVYKQIEQGIKAKVDKVVINQKENEIGIQTVRVYASQLSQFAENKLRVSVSGDNIIVYLTPVSKRELFEKEIVAALRKAVEEIGPDAAGEVMSEAHALVLGDGGQYMIPVEEIGPDAAGEIPKSTEEDQDF